MPLSFTRFVFGAQQENSDSNVTDIPFTVTDGVEARGGSYIIAGLTEIEAWVFETYCSNASYNPAQTVPPLPPVYPVLFSSDLVYGREHFSETLKMFRNDTYSRKFVVIQDGQLYNLTGCTIRMTFKWDITDTDGNAFLVLTSPSNGISITNPTGGEFQFTITPSQTSTLPAHRVDLNFDAQVTDINGNVYTVAWGKFAVLPDASVTAP